jgi:DNA-binding transcriptional ArsR family regulator
MRELVKTTKALADPNRLLILQALSQGELCVCWLVAGLGLAPSTVSKHLSILENAGLVEFRREGRWAYYRLAAKAAGSSGGQMLEWLLPAVDQALKQENLKSIREKVPGLLKAASGLSRLAKPIQTTLGRETQTRPSNRKP